MIPAYSGYFVVLNPGPQVLQATESTTIVIILQVRFGLLAVN